MSLILLSFLAGILTVLAPCAFMLLPVIIGGSVTSQNRLRPYIITVSLAASLFLFTVLLKTSSLFVTLNPALINYATGSIIVFLGLISLFPDIWTTIQIKLNLSKKSDELLQQAERKQGIGGAILTGIALGPVFSSCSPTYVFLLTTVIRESFATAIVNMIAYTLGLSLIMLLISVFGQKFTTKVRWAVNPTGLFKRVMALIFILVGLALIFGIDKQIQANFAQLPFVGQFEQKLLSQVTGIESKDIIPVKDAQKAPEIIGVTEWINSDGESLQNLEGKVVLIDFWTYSCVNCLRASPYLNEWYSKYKDDGFIIIGMHTPEFAFEKNKENVQKAIDRDYNFEFPVGLDNDYQTWDAYNNKFWPAKYLIDAQGNIRYTHFGEGNEAQTEAAIQALLSENGARVDQTISIENIQTKGTIIPGQTPETYLGWSRLDMFANKTELLPNQINNYTLEPELAENYWSISGQWEIRNEAAICRDETCQLNLRFRSKKVYLVASPGSNSQPVTMNIMLNGETIPNNLKGADIVDGQVTIDVDRLYELVDLESYQTNQLITLTIPQGVVINAFTFGG